MNRLIRSEALKLISTRTSKALALGTLAIIWAGVAVIAALSRFKTGEHPLGDTLSLAGTAQMAGLILGALAVTTEFRYRTIALSLLITPRRRTLLAAKLTALGAFGLAFGLIAFGGAAAIAAPILSGRGATIDPTHLAAAIAGGATATALFAALGVGLGALLRNQVGAIIAALGLVYLLEPMLGLMPGIGRAVKAIGLGGLSSAASSTTPLDTSAHLLAQAPALLVLAVYTLALSLAAAQVLRRAEIPT